MNESLKTQTSQLDWKSLCERLAEMATSAKAKELLRELDVLPSQDQAELQFSEIEECLRILSTGVRPHMESLDFYPLWHTRVQKGSTLKTLELKDVRLFCLEILALRESLNSLNSEWSSDIKSQLFESTETLSAIDRLMTPDGEIKTDASPLLDQLFREKLRITRDLHSTLDRLVKQHELETVLQERYVTTREGRFVLPIKSGRKGQFDGIVHSSSQSKQTLFMEPKELIPMNNRLREVESAIEEEVERLLAEISQYLRDQISDLERAEKILLTVDQRLAQAQLAQKTHGQKCRFVKNKIHLRLVRHPLLSLNEKDVVGNSVILDQEQRVLILSGPNAGGKTVLLKAIGLACMMARCGLLICAEPNSEVPFFNEVVVAVGDAQSVDAHLSTFAAHVLALDEASKKKGLNSLILIDEIAGSTDPDEGAALARSFIEAFAENQVFAVITSHLGPLKRGWDKNSGVINGSLEFDPQTNKPTYRFVIGVPGQSLALKTAQRVGINSQILKKAYDYLSPEQKKLLSSIEEVESMKKSLEDQRREAEKVQAEYRALLEKLEKEKQSVIENTKKDIEKRVDQMLEQAKVEDVFRRFEKLDQVKQDLPKIINANSAQKQPENIIRTAEDFAKNFPAGTKVYIRNLDREGIVQGAPSGKGDVPVLSQSMRITVPWQQLSSSRNLENPTFQLARKTVSSATLPTDEMVFDVRGLNVEQALSQAERTLDQALLRGLDRIKIVHGHGSEALKKNLRTFLTRSPYISRWVSGLNESGGDGITWAYLKDKSETAHHETEKPNKN